MDTGLPLAQDAPWQQLTSGELEDLARECGTPFFLYDVDCVTARIEAVRAAFTGLVKVYFAVKANPNLELLRALRPFADGLDVSSGGEVVQAALAGYDPSVLSFAGPAKTSAELLDAVQRSVGCISIESIRELHECVQAARQVGKKANVAVRVNPSMLNRAFGMKMGGKPIQFGIDEEALDDVLAEIAKHPAELNFRGIHVYAGSQCFDAAGIVDGVRNTLGMVRRFEDRTALRCVNINLGGGFGVSHVEQHRELDLATLSAVLRPEIEQFLTASSIERNIVFELGRYLVADAGIYIARVISSKASRGKNFFMADGGLHHHLAAAGTFGAAFRSNFLLRNLSHPDRELVECSISGPSCNPTDLLGVDVKLPRPELGDLIGVLKSGSYGLTASPLLFLGRQTPAEFVRTSRGIALARRPRSMTDFN